MSPAARPPEHYVHGLDGPSVVVPGRVARLLFRDPDLGLSRWCERHRGEDPELDAVLTAMKLTGAAWAATVADHGHDQDKQPPDTAVSGPWMSTSSAAQRIGCSPRSVRWAIAKGRLPARLVGDVWALAPEDVENYRHLRQAA